MAKQQEIVVLGVYIYKIQAIKIKLYIIVNYSMKCTIRNNTQFGFFCMCFVLMQYKNDQKTTVEKISMCHDMTLLRQIDTIMIWF